MLHFFEEKREFSNIFVKKQQNGVYFGHAMDILKNQL